MRKIKITDNIFIYNDMPFGWVEGKSQPIWHRRVYNMWRGMWNRVYHEIYWFGSLIYPEYDTLSNYVKFIESQPRFEEFCNTCDKISWNIDKDIKNPNNRNYYPQYMTLITQSENSKDRFDRKGNMTPKKPIIGINIKDKSVILSKNKGDIVAMGFDSRNISKCVSKERKTHKGYKWYKVNYKHNLRLRYNN